MYLKTAQVAFWTLAGGNTCLYGNHLVSLCDTNCKLAKTDSKSVNQCSASCNVVVLLYAELYCTSILAKTYITLQSCDAYDAFPSHYCLNMCSAVDNYTHARTVDTRLFSSPPTKSLGTRLLRALTSFT